MRPHLYLTANETPGLRSLKGVRDGLRSGRAARLWSELQAKVERELAEDAWTPASPLPGRAAGAIKHADREYTLVGLVANRMIDAALVGLLTGRRACAEAVMGQARAIYDTDAWPKIEAVSHLRCGDHCSLRRGQLALALGIAYDWLHALLTPPERAEYLAGFDTRFTDAFQVAHEVGDRFTRMTNNFVPVIYGGFAVAALSFADDYDRSGWLLEMCRPRMESYARNLFGPDGEFPESVQYAGSTARLVHYLMAEHYAAGGRADRFRRYGFDRFLRWYLHCVLPPGRVIGFGDPAPDMPPVVFHFAAMAAALREPVAQWLYLHYANTSLDTTRQRSLELLYFDPSVECVSPAGREPLGVAYGAIAQIVSSRSSWDADSCTSVLYAKADIEHNHCHADWGQVCLDGYGDRLIVDLGSTPGYPLGPKELHYNYQRFGHNVLMFRPDARDQTPPGRKQKHGVTAKASFDEARGGAWMFDLTDVYEEAARVNRAVLHLLPRVAVVLDVAELHEGCPISLRWHTGAEPELAPEGSFSFRTDHARLAARCVRLEGGAEFTVRHHAYQPPNNKDRLGEPLRERHEPFVEMTCEGTRCRLLTLFCVHRPDDAPATWRESSEGWAINTPEGAVRVRLDAERLSVWNADSGARWEISPS